MADAPLPVPQDHSDPEPHVLKALNERQREFCKHYVMTKGNAHKSARLAGYAVEEGKQAHAYRLLAMPHVQEGIAY
jgi:phage terminase small subunit